MSKPLPSNDFRAIREILEPEDFGVYSGESEEQPSDLITEDIWNGITSLPSDVSIRTSNHHGSLIDKLYRLTEANVAIGDEEQLYYYIYISAGDELEAVLFNALHGYYRQAIGGLRNALELTMIGTYCQIYQNVIEFEKWRIGEIEIGFGTACDKLGGISSVQALETYLHTSIGDSIFNPKNKKKGYLGGWARCLYSELCDYSHSRIGYTNIDFWQSNGPVYQPDAFILTAEMFFQTSALCYLLTKLCKPDFILPDHALQLFEPKGASWKKVAYHAYKHLF